MNLPPERWNGKKVRARGYSVDEQSNRGARSVGAPVFDQDGSIEAALALSGTTNQVNSKTMPRILDALKDAGAAHLNAVELSCPAPRVSGD